MSAPQTPSASLEARRAFLSALAPGRHAQNLRQAQRFLAAHPQDPFAHLMLARIMAESGNRYGAMQAASDAVRLSNFAPDSASLLARLYLEFGFLENLGPLLAEALARNPHAASLASDQGDYLVTVGKSDAALAEYRRALSLTQDESFILAVKRSMADVLRSLGRNEEAADLLSKLRGHPATEAFALARLAQVPRAPHAATLEKDIEAYLARHGAGLMPEDAALLWLSLGTLRDRRGAYDAAFAAWQEARGLNSPAYDPQAVAALVKRMTAFYTPAFFDALRAFGSPNPAPVFVVGMPRAGTTLVERILSAHSKIGSAGELGRVGRRNVPFLETYDKPGGMETLRTNALHGELIARAGEHMRLASLVAGGKFPLLIDKMPTQFLAAGYIHACLPQARFIHVARHPADTFISTYQNNFAADYAFAFDQTAFAHFYGQRESLMAHWRSVFPDRILDISYEKLVLNPETEIRGMLSFLGLEWEEACLRFHESTSAVRTFSRDQVRGTITAASVGRWRHYENHLDPLFKALESLGHKVER